MNQKPRIEIEFCTKCRFVLRAAWLAQELLMTFTEELSEVALVNGDGGVFKLRVDGKEIWDRSAQGCFPETKELKRMIRDQIAPDKDLGHTDRAANR